MRFVKFKISIVKFIILNVTSRYTCPTVSLKQRNGALYKACFRHTMCSDRDKLFMSN